jgi:2'-5' RNA ligase
MASADAVGRRASGCPSLPIVGSLDDRAPAPPPTETAVIVAVPAAEAVVDPYRQRLDSAAPWGVPAHVTVLYPFLPPEAVDEEALAALAAAVRSVPAFECSFADTEWFGADVLWLRPEPSEPLRQLTRAVWSAFPEHPPYAGVHDVITPHLTVGERAVAERDGAGIAALRQAEVHLRLALPLQQRIDSAMLIAGSPAPRAWRTLHRLPLG